MSLVKWDKCVIIFSKYVFEVFHFTMKMHLIPNDSREYIKRIFTSKSLVLFSFNNLFAIPIDSVPKHKINVKTKLKIFHKDGTQ